MPLRISCGILFASYGEFPPSGVQRVKRLTAHNGEACLKFSHGDGAVGYAPESIAPEIAQALLQVLYVKVKGQWKHLYRAVDKAGDTVDFLLRARRDKAVARRYFEKAIDHNGEPETITVDKSGANLAALEALNAERSTPIKVRQNKYRNNVVEQDHRAIKRIIKPMMGFKDFRCARIALSGIEIAHMIRKGQMRDDGTASTAAGQFHSLAI